MRVPKRVDHGERRRQIANALLRTAAARGLHNTGMREVAAEAGVSLRLVQYYFGTKEELLLAAMQHLAARFAERATARFREASESGHLASPCDVITAILAEGLPADDDRRTFYVVYTAYLALSLTDPALSIAPLAKNSDAVIDVVAAQLRSAQAAGDTPAHLDPDLEAFSLVALSAGLATSVLGGQSSIQQAQNVIDYHLYRLFPSAHRDLARAGTTGERDGEPDRGGGQRQLDQDRFADGQHARGSGGRRAHVEPGVGAQQPGTGHGRQAGSRTAPAEQYRGPQRGGRLGEIQAHPGQ